MPKSKQGYTLVHKLSSLDYLYPTLFTAAPSKDGGAPDCPYLAMPNVVGPSLRALQLCC